MAIREHTVAVNLAIEQGAEAWNAWRLDHPDVVVDQSGVNRSKQNLEGCNFDGVNFRDADLREARLGGCSFRGAILSGTHLEAQALRGIDFSGAEMVSIHLGDAELREANLAGANLNEAHLSSADLTNATLRNSNLSHSILNQATLVGANLDGARLNHASLRSTDLRSASLRRADLNRAKFYQTQFEGCKVDGTKLAHVQFAQDHEAMLDGSELVRYTKRDLLNWSSLRRVGELPFFGVSWTAFLGSLVGVNTIGLLNEHQLLAAVEYPIPIPEKMSLILLDAILLVFGSTIYRFRCPSRVQEFSENQWVEEHRHPRLIYIRDKLDRRKSQVVTALFFGPGIGLAIYLIGERLVSAAGYIYSFSP
jgi:uncharacterized protein YjbI with pentapeptide repeats